NKKYGYIDKSGKIVINPQFEKAYDFSKEGLAAVKINQKWGYIDKSGKIVINPQFEDAYSFKEGLALVKLSDKYGYIDKSGKIVINPQFEDAYSFGEEGLAIVKLSDKYGYIDKSGKIVINPQFEDAYDFGEEGLALVKLSDKYGYIDKSGKIVIDTQFYYAEEFKNGLALVGGEKYGYINKSGKYVWSYDKGADIYLGKDIVGWHITKKTDIFNSDDYFIMILDNHYKFIGVTKIELRISVVKDAGVEQPFRIISYPIDSRAPMWGFNKKSITAGAFVGNRKGKFELLIVGDNKTLASKIFEVR
ncbi:MAG TPA: WG repeat-containing protein, partial [Spirochaetota bacterium]|nr:WG repeat-containing protein [Spirochaetota bacterium]